MLRPTAFGFGTVVQFVEKFFNAIWVVISRLCLQPLLTVGVVWLALAAFLPDEKMTAELIVVFAVLTGLAAGYAVAATVLNVCLYLKDAPERVKAKRERKKLETEDPEPEEEEEDFAPPPKKKQSKEAAVDGEGETFVDKPRYFRVAQNPKYVMAEYQDRYELYYDDGKQLKFVKANLKKQEDNN